MLALDTEVRIELLAQARVVEQFGPQTGRPRVDTLKGSKHANMKELRFDAAGGVWRMAFAFDPRAQGDPAGGWRQGRARRQRREKTFYRQLIEKADKRFDSHLSRVTARRKMMKWSTRRYACHGR